MGHGMAVEWVQRDGDRAQRRQRHMVVYLCQSGDRHHHRRRRRGLVGGKRLPLTGCSSHRRSRRLRRQRPGYFLRRKRRDLSHTDSRWRPDLRPVPFGFVQHHGPSGAALLHPPQRNRFQAYDHWIIRQPARQRQSGQCFCHNADPQHLRQRRKVVHQRKRVFGRRQQRTRRKHYGGRRHRLQPHGLVCRNPAFQRENDHGHRGYRLQQRLHRNQWRSAVHGGVDPHSNSHLRCRGRADVLHPGVVRGGFAVRALHHANRAPGQRHVEQRVALEHFAVLCLQQLCHHGTG